MEVNLYGNILPQQLICTEEPFQLVNSKIKVIVYSDICLILIFGKNKERLGVKKK